MIKTIICPICGKQFQTSRPNKKYCCFTCKEAGNKLCHMRWKENNRGYHREYMQRQRQKERENNV